MIRFFFYFGISLALTIVQTSILPGFSVFSQSFDLLFVIVLSLSLRFSHPAIGVAVFLLGCAMDSVSGGPFGLYISAYVWIYILVRSLKSLVHLENIVFLICMSAVAVVVENAFLVFTFVVGKGAQAVCPRDLVFMVKQTVLALILVPLLVLAVDQLDRGVTLVARRFEGRRFDGLE
ncbi:MAG: rod shape-determining protein MreD [Desulfobacterium sp.]|nr:rod shape-determining protein MreD [Desulfobacterium sp.]